MCAPLRRSIGGHGSVDDGGDAVEHYTDQRKCGESKLEWQGQQRGNSCCRERLADDDGGAIAEPVGDEAAGKLARSPADEDQRQRESRSSDRRAFSDQQERQAHKKAAAYDAVGDAKQHENAKPKAHARRNGLTAPSVEASVGAPVAPPAAGGESKW